MTLDIFEGTWEEIQNHSDVLAGQQVRVTVLPAKEDTSDKDRAEWLEFIERTAGSWKGEPLERAPQGEYEKRNWPENFFGDRDINS